ncbi:MAG: caspase family protein [Haliscomenobacter sp.]|uniref:caspase family protein n=1 Tax=Haliscomenobacter sp. TaxID=2717303 RepID=UPI0029A76DBF|nr:caspase family protein [Haliscomenobacter sp.]MDX2068199.1 caspase family protein [Haliscomenobacter sp.]
MPKLYALLVAVNHYPNTPGAQLNGPIGDLEKIEDYLKQAFTQDLFSTVQIQKLTSPATTPAGLPSKSNIVKGLSEFLGQAQAGDTVFFYYSGHGVREQTDILAFSQAEIDGYIANITAYDFDINEANTGHSLLSDKELRYLIRQLGEDENGQPKAHVVTIFDCCHSGENTRSPEEIQEAAIARQIVRKAISGRPKEGFIFYHDPTVAAKLDSGAPLNELLPLGPHVMLAACREVELAWEYPNVGGAFTEALVDVLKKHEGLITYQELHYRILNRMRFFFNKDQEVKDHRQTPQLFVQGISPEAHFRRFLSNAPQERSGAFPVEYAAQEKEWRLGAGALHGISPKQQEHGNAVQVFDPKNPAHEFPAEITAVFPTHSTLGWPQAAPASNGNWYAKVEGLSIPPLNIYLSGATKGVEFARLGLNRLTQETASAWFQEVPEEEQADYVLEARDDLWFTRYPFDYRPLLLPIRYQENGKLLDNKWVTAFNDFEQMAKWHYLKNLEYFAAADPKRSTADWPIEVRLFIQLYDGTEERVFPKNGQFLIPSTLAEPQKAIRFELENHSDQLLYCSLAFMDYQFGFYSAGIMMRSQQGLEKNAVFYSKHDQNSKYILCEPSNYVKTYHWPGEEYSLKLIVSRTPFNLENFDMDGLPLPGDQYSSPKRILRPKTPVLDWEIRTYGLFFTNPYFDEKKAMALAKGL